MPITTKPTTLTASPVEIGAGESLQHALIVTNALRAGTLLSEVVVTSVGGDDALEVDAVVNTEEYEDENGETHAIGAVILYTPTNGTPGEEYLVRFAGTLNNGQTQEFLQPISVV